MEARELRLRRLALNRSQEDVARAADISTSYYGVLERGRCTPTLTIARRIAEVLGTTVDTLWPVGVSQEGSSESESAS